MAQYNLSPISSDPCHTPYSDPWGPQGPAGIGFVAGMRWTPANRIGTGTATPPDQLLDTCASCCSSLSNPLPCSQGYTGQCPIRIPSVWGSAQAAIAAVQHFLL